MALESTVHSCWLCRVMKQHPSLQNWLEWRDCIVVCFQFPVLKITGSQAVNYLGLRLLITTFHPPLSKDAWLPPINVASFFLADAGPVSVVSEASFSDLNHRLVERTLRREWGWSWALTWFRTMPQNIEISGWAWSSIWTGWEVDSEKWWCLLNFVRHTAVEVGRRWGYRGWIDDDG